MKVGIHQPQYMAWPGYFAKIAAADTFILYDTAQYQKNALINRNAIRVRNEEHLLTIPVVTGHVHDQIRAKTTVDERWKIKHLKTLEANYSQSPFFKEIMDIFKQTVAGTTQVLSEINIANIRAICAYLGLNTSLLISSHMGPDHDEDPTQKLIQMIQKVSGKVYIGGTGAKNYLNEALMASNGIDVQYFQYVPSEYPQQGQGHVPGLSIIDMIANIPKDEVRAHLKKGWVVA